MSALQVMMGLKKSSSCLTLEDWAISEEGRLGDPIGQRCPLRSVQDIKDYTSKHGRVQTGGSCAMLFTEDTELD